MRHRYTPALILTALVVLVAAVFWVAADEAGGATTNRQQIKAAICHVFTGTRCGPALRVVSCETGGTFDPHAVSRTGDYGLFQANYAAHHRPGETRTEFAARHFNIRYHIYWAYRLSRGGTNWRPWTCRP